MKAPADHALVEEISRSAWRDAFLRALLPEPRITVSEWADRHRLLSTRTSSEPGRWRTERTPYLREIMDCLSTSSPVETLVFCKGAQVGGTECGNNWIGYVIDHSPGPMMLVGQSGESQVRKSRQTLDALFEDTPSLRAKVSPRKSRDPGNTTRLKIFPGGMLVLATANSKADLRSLTARYLFLDEVDAYDDELEGGGDPVELAERATKTYGNRFKVFKVSTPLTEGRSRIWRSFLQTDRRYFHVPCPACGYAQRLLWKNLRWDANDDEESATVATELEEGRREVRLLCESCGALVEEHQKEQMLPAGTWVPEDPSRGERVRGYHLSALYSPFGMYSWRRSAAKFLRAKGRPAALRVWVNEDLGEPYKEKGDAPDWRRIFERREHYQTGIVPRGGFLLTCGVDVQADRLEYEVVAWGPDYQSWSVEYVVCPGDPDGSGPFEELDRLLSREWEHEDGGPACRLGALGIDTSYKTQRVYGWVRKFGRSRRVFALDGRVGTHVLVGVPKRVDVQLRGKTHQRGVAIWPVDVGMAKEELYGWLEQLRPVEESHPMPPGFCHFPGYGPEYFKGLCSEVLVPRRHRTGRSSVTWERIYERNEPLDCRVYARAVAHVLGMDRWTRDHWLAVRGLAPDAPTPEAPSSRSRPEAGPEREDRFQRGRDRWRRRGPQLT